MRNRTQRATLRPSWALLVASMIAAVCSCTADDTGPGDASDAGTSASGGYAGAASEGGQSSAGESGAGEQALGGTETSAAGSSGSSGSSGSAGELGTTSALGGARSMDEPGSGGDAGAGALPDHRHRWLVFLSPINTAEYSVYLLDMLGAGFPRTLLPGAGGPTFSPDGHWLVDTTATTLELRDVSGSALAQPTILAQGSPHMLAWSPDSQWLAYQGSANDLWLCRIATGDKFKLSDAVSPSNARIDFVASRWGTRAVFTTAGSQAYYVNLVDVTPAEPPAPLLIAQTVSNAAGWIGDQYYVLDQAGASQTTRYAHFDASGLNSLKTVTSTITQKLFITARNSAPPRMLLGSSSGFAPELWFDFDTAQLVQWPAPAVGASQFLAYSPNCELLARQTDANNVDVVQASDAEGLPVTTLPVAGVLPTVDDYNWSPGSELLTSQWNDRIRVTSFSPSVVTKTIPGDYSATNSFFWKYAFGAHGAWISFQGVIAGQGTTPAAWFRWFSIVDGTNPGVPQKFSATIGSIPSESPDHSRIALLSDSALEVVTLSQGVLSAPRTLLPLSRDDLLSASALTWSADSTHVAVVTNQSNTTYSLHVVDAQADPPVSVTVQTFNGAYAMQP